MTTTTPNVQPLAYQDLKAAAEKMAFWCFLMNEQKDFVESDNDLVFEVDHVTHPHTVREDWGTDYDATITLRAVNIEISKGEYINVMGLISPAVKLAIELAIAKKAIEEFKNTHKEAA